MLDLAVVGYGWWGRHVTPRLALHLDLRVVCVAEPDRALHPEVAATGADPVDDREAPYPWSDADLIHNIAVYETIVASARNGETATPPAPQGAR